MAKATTKTVEDKSAPFKFHGVTLTAKSGQQSVGDCPLCGKEQHFYVSIKTGQWDCKSCNESGNAYTFLQKLYDTCDGSPKDLKQLSQHRNGIPYNIYQKEGVRYSAGRFYLPNYNQTGSLVNLRVWDGPGSKVFSTAGMKLHMLREHMIPFDLKTLKGTPIYICEGDWDTYAFEWLRLKVDQEGIVVGTPGTIFKEEWLEMFKGCDVSLLGDNDTPGLKFMEKTSTMLKPIVSQLKVIRWPSTFPDGGDISDYIADRIKTPQKAWDEIRAMLVDSKQSSSSPEKKRSAKVPPFAAVLRVFRKHLHLDKNMEDALAVILATALSIKIPGDPLWTFIVGPPGSGKTVMLRSLEGCPEQALFRSTITSQTLVSGFIPTDGADPSLLATLPGKCLIIKDYTAVKSLPSGVQEELYGIMRDAYDGQVTRQYGNQAMRVFPTPESGFPTCHFSLVAGVTHVIHGDNRATLGERFLKFEFIREDHDPEAHIRSAITGMEDLLNAEKEMRDIVAAFMDRDIDPAKLPKIPSWVVERIVALSQLIGLLRAGVERGFKDELVSRPRVEIGTRLAKQLIKMGQVLAVVFGSTSVDKKCWRLMEQMAFDTAYGWNLDILRVMMSSYPRGMLMEEIASAANISDTTLQRKLDNMIELRSVYRQKPAAKEKGQIGRGRPPYKYFVAKQYATLWKKAKVGE